MKGYAGVGDRFPTAGPPSEKFAIQSWLAHFFRPRKTEFITPGTLVRINALGAWERSFQAERTSCPEF